MAMATTIQVSETLVKKLKHAKEDFGVSTYEEVIDRLVRQHEVRFHSRAGSRPWLTWNRETDRMRARTDD
jgi:hypothetical protein